jgi:DNA-binding NtrC family response regulator
MSRQRPDLKPTDAAVRTILVVDDDASLRSTLADLLETLGYRTLVAGDGVTALRALQRDSVDLVLTDLIMPGMTGEQLVLQVRDSYPDVPAVAMTSFPSLASAAAVGRSGAADYLAKPLDLGSLRTTVETVLERWEPQRRRRLERLSAGRRLRGIIGRSRAMQELFQQISRVAPSQAPVLITGETGTGKDLIAQAVHRASGREPFVPVNCGAIPTGLLESELFGHVRGAFTGADRDRVGLFEAAHEGTIFLDEIAELPLGLQSKLLRVLQSGEFRRVGDVEPRYVKVRLIAATHRNLATAVDAGEFREDLFYRVNVLHLSVPPLRERPTDIPLLAEHMLAQVARREGKPLRQFSATALAHIVGYEWPGNVRQLQNVIERMAILADGERLELDDLPPVIRGAASADAILQKLGTELTLADVEREHILAVLHRAGGNRSRAAKVLGLPRRTLYRRLDEYGLTGEAE